MKTNLSILAIPALAALSLASCSPSGGGSYTTKDAYVKSITEVTGDDTRVITYTRDKFADVSGETQTLNGFPVYKIENYETKGNAITRYKTWHENNSRQKIVSTFVLAGPRYQNDTYKVYAMNGDVAAETPLESSMYEYNDSGNVVSEKHYENGNLMRELKNYNFFSDRSGYSYTEWTTGSQSEGVQMRYTVTKRSTDNVILEYEIRAGWDSSVADSGVVVEKVTDYNYDSEKSEETYTRTKYDSTGGSPVETHVTVKYEMITVTFEY
jgi:hypothetical protein